jgi:D-3-phosphoglycerate dehydrogenase
MNYRIFITGSGIADEAMQLLAGENCITEIGEPGDTPADLIRKLGNFDPHALIVRQGQITAEVQNAAQSLKVICKHGVGTDNIDIKAATNRGIPAMFTPGQNFEAVAEHTLALILALARQIPFQDKQIRNGIFDKKSFGGLELLGKTLGLIGYGRIGRRLAELVSPFKMNVVVYHPSHADEPASGYISKVQHAADVYPQADIISLHCPLTDATNGMINSESIALMKPGALIVNTARGAIVNEGNLYDALKEKRIAGAALDCFETEPPAADNPLFHLDNVILTTHTAGMSDHSTKNVGLAAARNVLDILQGRQADMEAVLNREVLQ